MVQELTYGWKVAGEVSETSIDGLRAILGQIEADLYHSEIYGQVLSNLQTLPTDVSHQVQRMVKAVGREAIRLAFRRFIKKSVGMPFTTEFVGSKPAPSVNPRSQSTPPPPPPPSIHPELTLTEDTAPSSAAPSASDLPTPSPSGCDAAPASTDPMVTSNAVSVARKLKKKIQSRLNQKEIAAQAAIEAWETRLRELGQEIRRERQAQCLSVHQLHFRTQIPIHQLEALEAGRLDKLPEDIYIRGFIRRVGDALRLDGAALANSVPVTDPLKTILPTWYRPKEISSGLQLRPVHLYLGYAAILVGGLTWLSQQSPPQDPTLSTPPPDSPAPAPSPPDSNSNRSSGEKATKPTMIAPAAIAPPEVQPF